MHPEHRTGIAFLKLWDEANEFLTAHGMAWSLSRISAFNGNSSNSHGKMGARRMGVAVFLSIGAWQLSCSSVAPQVFFTASRARYPVVSSNYAAYCSIWAKKRRVSPTQIVGAPD